ncbi:hypothetical protein LMF57_11750 [Stenotrophomonas sp. SI-NJAU-1]|jgi:hypothetical protein|uniref:hypothetical protein n=1 Tax=Stenotrophomonas sp. SI-NJAU-1 TaxID=2886359 RepID=UPI001E4D3F8E|nr:hypothetical protein [Stenotrophomonas sp. SI-NJAU-1]UEX16697.1 hypothetical protein LMF57_11750 [Stenotrophomonas sp. SI-NJAU-1]
MQRMTIDGKPRPDAGKAEGDVVRFLDYGYSLNNDFPIDDPVQLAVLDGAEVPTFAMMDP